MRTIAPPHGFDLASAKAPRLGAGARRAAAILAALGRSVADADAAVLDAILALPAKLDPLRAAALTALPCVRSRPRPACAGRRNRSPVRRRDQRGRQPTAARRNNAGGAAGVLVCFARGLCGRAPAATRPHLEDSRSPVVLVMIAGYDWPSESFAALGNRPKPHPPRAHPLRP